MDEVWWSTFLQVSEYPNIKINPKKKFRIYTMAIEISLGFIELFL